VDVIHGHDGSINLPWHLALQRLIWREIRHFVFTYNGIRHAYGHETLNFTGTQGTEGSLVYIRRERLWVT